MTARIACTFLLTMFVCVNHTNAQNDFGLSVVPKVENCKETFLDSDGRPFKIQWFTDGKLDSIKYVRQDGVQLNAKFLLIDVPEFVGGFDSLKSFFKKNFKKPSGIETNGMTSVLFLFHNNDIDVRVIQRIGYSNQRYNYDKEIKRVLMLTKPNWRIKHFKDVENPLVFIYFFKIP